MVRFSELRDETNTFEFLLEESFFQKFDSTEWEAGKVKALLDVVKRADGITMDLHLKGTLSVTCDRCLEPFPFLVDTLQRLYVKYGHQEEELDDNVVVVSREDNMIDLGSYFYEYLVLALPLQRVHPEMKNGKSGCNPEMMQKLGNHIVREESERSDPRSDELKKLIDKN